MYDVDALYSIQSKLLIPKLPLYLPGLESNLIKFDEQKINGFFFNIVQPAVNVIDVMIGQVKGEEFTSVVMAVATRMALLRLAKPLFKDYHFDKKKMWDKNLLSLSEIILRINEEIGFFLKEFGLSLNLFYGRFNLDYNLFDYINCGFPQPLHYHSIQQYSNFLNIIFPPIGTPSNIEFRQTQIHVELGDIISFYLANSLEDTYSKKNEGFIPHQLMSLIEDHATSSITGLSESMMEAMKQNRSSVHDLNAFAVIVKLNKDRSHVTYNELKAKFTSDLSQLDAVRNFVQKICKQSPGDTEKLSLQLQLVVNEVFCNIIKHSYHNYPKMEITIESKLTQEGIYLTISDKGDSFNPKEIKYPDFSGNQEDGFGFFIIQQIADRISYISKNPGTDEYNHLCIFKRYFSEEEQMDFAHEVQDNVLVITPKGENLDAKNSAAFKENILNLIRLSGVSQLVFDLHQLQFIDSSGLGTFLAIQRTLNAQGGVLKLANLNKPIKTMFEIVSMHKIFDIFNSTEQAVMSF